MPPLTDLSPADHAIIHEVRGHGALRKRLLDMGVIPGAEIAVVRVAPLGDPVEYLVKGYHLSLRYSEAQQILVRRLTDDEQRDKAAPEHTGRWKRWLSRRGHGE